MLSERFNIALCTKPPMPFVGEAGRWSRSGDICPGNDAVVVVGGSKLISMSLLRGLWIVIGGLKMSEVFVRVGDVDSEKLKPGSEIGPESLLPFGKLPFTGPTTDGELIIVLPGNAMGSFSKLGVESLDIPGSFLLSGTEPLAFSVSS